MWQDNLSWREGLFSNIPWTRGQAIRAGEPLAFFSHVNNAGNDDWANLRFEGIMEHDSKPLSKLETLFGKESYIVAVNTRIRTISASVEVMSKDSIKGSVDLSVDYKVVDLGQLLELEDPLRNLLDRVGEIVQQKALIKAFRAISPGEINLEIKKANLKALLGIEIIDSRTVLEWPDDIVTTLGERTRAEILSENQQAENDRRVEKLEQLAAYNIRDKLLVAAVLSKGDEVFESVMELARNASVGQKEQYREELELLKWLTEKEYVSRVDAKTISENLVHRLNEQANKRTFLGFPQIDITTQSKTLLESGAGEDLEHEELDVKTRSVNIKEKENEDSEKKD